LKKSKDKPRASLKAIKDGSGLREDTSRLNEVKKSEDKPRASLKPMLWRALAVGAAIAAITSAFQK
jgi:hypothetical protein